MVLHKDKHIDLWNRTENPGINPCTYNQLILFFNKNAKAIQWRKNGLFNNDAETTAWPHEKVKLNSHHIQKLTQMGQKPKCKN